MPPRFTNNATSPHLDRPATIESTVRLSPPETELILKRCDELGAYLALVRSDGGELAVEYRRRVPVPKQRPFERIRRITGYLVGTVERWNGAKRAELADRVKHVCKP